MNSNPKMSAALKATMENRIKALRAAGEHNKADDMQLVLLHFANPEANRMITDIVAARIGM